MHCTFSTNRFRRAKRRLLFLACFILFGPVALFGQKPRLIDQPRVLVFTKTTGWDHKTRIAADSIIRNLGMLNGFNVDTTDVTGSFFADSSLARYAAVCFINTTGAIFTTAERDAFKRYMRAGGGYVGMHASTDGEFSWSWYGEMTGAFFNGHPFNVATAKVAILDKNHPSTEFIADDTLTRRDEWYFWGQNPDFRNNPLIDPAENDSLSVLMELVESSLPGSTRNQFHPICWYRYFEGGRVWYCGFGHEPQIFNDPLVKRMLLGGIRYAAGMTVMKTAPEKAASKPAALSAGRYCLRVYNIQGRAVYTSTQSMHCPLRAGLLWNMRDNTGSAVGAGYYIVTAVQGTEKTTKAVIVGQ